MNLERLSYKFFSNSEAAISDLKKNTLQVNLPLGLGDPLSVLEDLAGSLNLASELKVFGIVKHCH